MKNQFEVSGEVTIIKLKSKKYGNMETLISTSKLSLVLSLNTTWRPFPGKRDGEFYAIGALGSVDGVRKNLFLHRLVTNAPRYYEVDHRNHCGLDNRDENLRVLNTSQNQQNRKGATRKSSSGIRGVHWHKHAKKWEVQVKVDGKKITIGRFADIKEAEKASIDARNKYMPFSS